MGSRGQDGWIAPPTQWKQIWANSGRQWRTEGIRLKRSYQRKQAKQKDARGPHTNKIIWAPGSRLACCSVSQYCLTSWDHKDYSAPGIPVLHNLWELAQAHVHWIGDVIQPLCPLFSLLLLPSIFPRSGSFPMTQLFASGGQRIGASTSASMNIQGWFPLGLTGLISLQSKGLSRFFSNTTVKKHQFFNVQLSL